MDGIKRFFALIGVLVMTVSAVGAVQIVGQMSQDARALGVGAMAGCLAGLLPVLAVGIIGLIVARVMALRRDVRPQGGPYAMGPYGGYQQQPPPVIIMGGGMGQMPQWGQYPPQLPTNAWEMGGGERSFNVIGEED